MVNEAGNQGDGKYCTARTRLIPGLAPQNRGCTVQLLQFFNNFIGVFSFQVQSDVYPVTRPSGNSPKNLDIYPQFINTPLTFYSRITATMVLYVNYPYVLDVCNT